jgi:hypothetical protein
MPLDLKPTITAATDSFVRSEDADTRAESHFQAALGEPRQTSPHAGPSRTVGFADAPEPKQNPKTLEPGEAFDKIRKARANEIEKKSRMFKPVSKIVADVQTRLHYRSFTKDGVEKAMFKPENANPGAGKGLQGADLAAQRERDLAEARTSRASSEGRAGR